MGSYSVREIFDLLPIRDNEEFRLKLCERYNITEEYIFHQSEMKGELISQLLNDILKQYQGLLEEQYNYLKIYMDENIGDSQCLLVNNSINGNGQFLLEQFLKKTGIQAKIIGMLRILRWKKRFRELKKRIIVLLMRYRNTRSTLQKMLEQYGGKIYHLLQLKDFLDF